MNPTDRQSALEQMCQDDSELRFYVEQLLECDLETEDAFAERNLGIGPRLLSNASGHHASPALGAPENGRFLPGTKVADRYRIVCLLGRGGMGEVYRADDLKIGTMVALKFLPSHLSNHAQALDYFINEVRLARQITHPNVCRVYDIGEEDGFHFISMEFVDGEDLKSLIKRIGPPARVKGAEIAKQLCIGLNAAHQKGVLHRDLKPANVMIDGRGQVRITDFGLARLTSDEDDVTLLGTPAYMAPEQRSRGEATVASDIYSLGLVLYEIFTGEPYHQEPRQDHFPFQSPRPVFAGWSSAEIDPQTQKIVSSCLSLEPDQRPASALSVAAAIPGKTSLDATLALGETPSPEMGAAVGDKTLSARISLAMIVGIMMGVVVIGVLSQVSQRAIQFRVDEPIKVQGAREPVRQFGYERLISDSSWGLEWNQHYFASRTGGGAFDAWTKLSGAPPTAATLWFRSSPTQLVSYRGHAPYAAFFVTPDDPPNVEPGMVRLRLESDGRLQEFVAVPTSEMIRRESRSGLGENHWRDQLLTVAGIDSKDLERQMELVPAAHRSATPPVFADHWEQWRSEKLVVELAGYMGYPVYFRIANIDAATVPAVPRPFEIVFSISALSLFTIAVVFARRRWLDKSADLRGAKIMFVFILVTSLLYWCLQAHHVVSGEELAMFLKTLGRALLRATVICAAYLALEPIVRRRWPRSLVGWNRLLQGRFRDPIVGRDILVGVVAGVLAQLVGSAGLLFGGSRQIVLLADPILNIGSGPFDLRVLMGPQSALGQICAESFLALVGGFVAVPLFFVILRAIFRKSWLAAVALVLFYSMPALIQGDVHGALSVMVWTAMGLYCFFRFGILAVVVGWCAWRLLAWPVSFDHTTAHLNVGLVAHLAIVALTCWVYFSSLRSISNDESEKRLYGH